MADIEQDAPLTVWTLIFEPDVEGDKPTWAAWVNADDANWGTLRILHVPTKKVVLAESVSLALDISAFWTGRTSEVEWEELVRNWVAAREGEFADA